jgi:hypothetical protein
MQAISQNKNGSYAASFSIAILVFFISLVAYGQYGFTGHLWRDNAIVLYSGQQMARGIPHYLSIFDNSGVVAPLIAGIGASIATILDCDDILAVRIAFLVLGALAAVGVYFLGSTLFRSRKTGFLAALVFIGFRSFGTLAISGPRIKTPMVLFVILSLVLTARRKWFWAGLCGSLAFLAWPPTAIFPLVTLILALLQSRRGRERVRHLLFTFMGMLIPKIIVSAYFLSKGAFYEFVDGLILFNITQMEHAPTSLRQHFTAPLDAIWRGYTVMSFLIFLGFLMILMIYIWRIRSHGSSILRLLSEDRFAALLLSFPAPLIWSFLDFQSSPDFFIFLPYLAVCLGWLLSIALRGLTKTTNLGPALEKFCFLAVCAALVASAALDYRKTANNGLGRQLQWAYQVESTYGRDAKLVSIGVPEILVLLHRTNPNPYVFIIDGIDKRIDKKTPGGFDAWLQQLEQHDPDVIAFGPTDGPFKAKLVSWLRDHFNRTTVGGWTLFVKNGFNDRLIQRRGKEE